MTDQVSVKRRRRRKDDRPGEILAAGLALFADRGFMATRLDDVAERAGVAKGTIYLYFSSKEELFEAVVRDAFAPVFERMAGAMALPEASGTVLLTLVLQTIYRELIATERREVMRLLIAEAKRFPNLVDFYHREAVSRGKAVVGEILRRGIERGEFRDGPATHHPEVIIGPAILSAIWKLVFDTVDPMNLDAMAAAHLDLVFNGVVNQIDDA